MKFSIDANSDRGESRAPVENYRSRRAKYRLLAIVFSLMLVVVLMGEALKPATWERLLGTLPADTAAAEEDIDTRLEGPLRPSLPPGVFVSELSPRKEDDSAGKSQLGINLGRYGAIKDNTVFRSAEMSVWFDTLVAIRDLSPSDASSLHPQVASFTQLYRQPDQYRGRVVQVTGTVRRADYHRATKNDHDVAGYWQCWLRPRGSQNPIVVYALELPDGFARGDDIHEYATFTGVFFKRWAYEATGGIMTAPVVLAQQIVWSPPVVEPPTPLPQRNHVLLTLAGMGLLSSVIAAWAYRNSVRSAKQAESYRDQDGEAQVAIEKLSHADIPSEHDAVRNELARREGGASQLGTGATEEGNGDE